MTLNTERQQHIIQFIRTYRRATVEELSAQFGVSEATIRRDLQQLSSLGAIQRAHGGAIAVDRAAPEPPVLGRMIEHAGEKRRIGAAAAALIDDGSTIFLGSGSTTLEVARHLGHKQRLTVITNALTIGNQLSSSVDVSLIITGGLLRPSELSMVGHVTEQTLRELRPDKTVMGIRAINLADGLTNEYGVETGIDRLLVQRAAQLIVVADASKLGRVANVSIGPVTAMHTLVTSVEAPPALIDEIRAAGVRVVLA